jgi:nucleoside-diphosphate-sugar epimerase
MNEGKLASDLPPCSGPRTSLASDCYRRHRGSGVPTLSVNIEGTWSLLEACRRTPGVDQILLASSDKAYGEAERLPVDEKAPLQGLGPYEASKACADLIGHAYARAYGLPIDDRPTFVTGGTGLLGRWLVKRLVEVGARVICLVRKRPSKAEFANAGLPAHTQQVEGDIRDPCLQGRRVRLDWVRLIGRRALLEAVRGLASRAARNHARGRQRNQ